MSHDINALAAELFEIWHAGMYLLPDVARVYAEATQGLNQAGADAAPAFTQSTYLTNEFLPAWDQLRDELQDILARSAESLADAGTALCQIANGYLAVDEHTRWLFDNDPRFMPSIDGDVPPVVPEITHSTDPLEP
jgi:hypothetical protein